MSRDWKPYFFKELEKTAIIMPLLTAGMTALDISTNKAKMKLDPPGFSRAVGNAPPYSHQFKPTSTHLPNRSIFR